jgi:hypothetical protein
MKVKTSVEGSKSKLRDHTTPSPLEAKIHTRVELLSHRKGVAAAGRSDVAAAHMVFRRDVTAAGSNPVLAAPPPLKYTNMGRGC